MRFSIVLLKYDIGGSIIRKSLEKEYEFVLEYYVRVS